MPAENINNQVDEMVTIMHEFKELLVDNAPQQVEISDEEYEVADLTDEEILYYNRFVTENFNKIIEGYEEATNALINPEEEPRSKIYDSYLFFKHSMKNMLFYIEMIAYTIVVKIYQEPLRYEHYDRSTEEWYPSDEPEEVLEDRSSCANSPNFENISIEVQEMAWYGLMQHIKSLYSQASYGYRTGAYMVYRRD